MIFQTLDDKNNCVAFYFNGDFQKVYEQEMTHSWVAPAYLQHLDIEYAYLYAQCSLDDACPEHLKTELKECIDLLKAYMTSFVVSKLDMNQHCFYDLVPEHFLKRFCEIKNKICSHIFSSTPRPPNYAFLKGVHEIAQEISNRKLSLDFSSIPLSTLDLSSRKRVMRLKESSPYIRYNIFGSKTGRFSTKPNSFPILTLKKELRSVIKPTNDMFVELDFNAFDLRVLLFLLGKEQPTIDIHDWNKKYAYQDKLSRKEAKTRIFSWLYNLESGDRAAEAVYDREKIIQTYWDGSKVTNPFGTELECNRFHALSYLVQSTAAELVLRQMVKIHKILQETSSHIAFTIHDSVVIDMAEEDVHLIPKLKDSFASYRRDNFLVNVSVGKDFGSMESLP